MNILVFEDARAPQMYPMALARPMYAISCGSYRLVDWLSQPGVPVYGVVRSHLLEIQQADFPAVQSDACPSDEPALLVNARAVPSASNWQCLQKMVREGRPSVVFHDGDVAAAVLPADSVTFRPAPWAPHHLDETLQAAAALPRYDGQVVLFGYAHDVIRQNARILAENLEARIRDGDYEQAEDGIFTASGVNLGSACVADTSHGPIVIDHDAQIGPFCYLSGPVYIGPNARVIEHAALKDGVSAGHTTKIGGEIEASVIEPYTNKQHHGFLGHSYFGSWVNLGAGTCNSDLKNTYGSVNMEYCNQRVPTGMQFIGCIIGDYSKTAINTGIFTGKCIGVCSMLYGFVTTNVPSFVNYARLFGQVTELPPEVMIATQQRMFQRRQVVQRPCDIQLIHDMYELTRHERQLAGEPLVL